MQSGTAQSVERQNLMANWQDKAFAVCAVIMSFGLIPQLFDPQKPTIATALTTIVCLGIIMVGEWTIKLKFAAAATCFQVCIWTILLLQRIGQ